MTGCVVYAVLRQLEASGTLGPFYAYNGPCRNCAVGLIPSHRSVTNVVSHFDSGSVVSCLQYLPLLLRYTHKSLEVRRSNRRKWKPTSLLVMFGWYFIFNMNFYMFIV